jgi:CRP/FNR family cyclic AMP-dependent transcriptional regulator
MGGTMIDLLWKNIFLKKEKDTSSILKENILFQDLTKKELKFVTNIVHIRNFKSQETIFRQGETGLGMYIIINGRVDITVEDHQREGKDTCGRKDTLLTSLTSGDFFGELALVEESGKRSATATAVETTELIGFFKPNLFTILERRPALGVKITLRLSEVLGRRLIETNEKMSCLEHNIENRV